MDVKKVGRNIADIRRENNMTQEQLAQVFNISAPAISKWENGHTLPDVSFLPELAKVFNCTIDHILLNDLNAKPATTLSDFSLAEQIISIMEGRNMIGMSNSEILNAFSEKHGSLGNAEIIRNRSTRSDRAIFNSITVNVNGKSYKLIEKILFGDLTELYRYQLLRDFAISVPLVYRIDIDSKYILMEDLSDNYISGREFDENTQDGDFYRSAYENIVRSTARFHASFWDNDDAFSRVGLPWQLECGRNYEMHSDGMRKDLHRFLEMFPGKLSSQSVEDYEKALDFVNQNMPCVIKERFQEGKNITVIHGDHNPSNTFVSRTNIDDVRFLDMESMRMGLPTDDLVMLLSLHLSPAAEADKYLKIYYDELSKTITSYSYKNLLSDYALSVSEVMMFPIGVVGVRMNIFDGRMIENGLNTYRFITSGRNKI